MSPATKTPGKTLRFLGIDLGTTNSVMAAVEAAVPTVLPNSEVVFWAGRWWGKV